MRSDEREQLEAFVAEVRTLKVHRSAQHGPSLKKPLLLLVALARLERGSLPENRIRLPDIEDELSALISRYGGRRGAAHADEAFARLATSRFWSLHISGKSTQATPGPKALRALDSYAALEPRLYELLKRSPEARRGAINAVLDTWIPSEKRDALQSELGLG